VLEHGVFCPDFSVVILISPLLVIISYFRYDLIALAALTERR
jgi:hypothetical protein